MKSPVLNLVFFNNILSWTLFSKSSALFMYPLVLCILLTLSLTEVPVSIPRILYNLPLVLMHYMEVLEIKGISLKKLSKTKAPSPLWYGAAATLSQAAGKRAVSWPLLIQELHLNWGTQVWVLPELLCLAMRPTNPGPDLLTWIPALTLGLSHGLDWLLDCWLK